MLICGIDPGQSGGLAILDVVEWTLQTTGTPTFAVKKSGKTKKGNDKIRHEYDLQGIRSFLYSRPVAHVFVEFVNAMPKQGVASSFNFGKGYGMLLGLIAGKQIAEYRIHPRIWKKHFNLTSKTEEEEVDKAASRMKASQLAPQCAGMWDLCKEDGIAEAFLIALYGASTLGIVPTKPIIPFGIPATVVTPEPPLAPKLTVLGNI